MTRVVAPGRLHFGLLHVPTGGATHWPGPDGSAALPARKFGGIGLMVDAPGVAVRVTRADEWRAEGPSAARALSFARECSRTLAGSDDHPLQIVVEQCPPEHVGLGVGTQLGLAVAKAVAVERGAGELPAAELARAVGRGERSGVGVHGFAGGGFVLEGGKANDRVTSPLLGRYDFPTEWRIVLARPRGAGPRWSGAAERQAFARARSADDVRGLCEQMCRVLVLGILPALLERDCATFGEALHEYNRFAGRMFAADQGGDYASPEVEQLVGAARAHGSPGAGQSSWGPTVFAVCADPDAADRVTQGLNNQFADLAVTITTANNKGAIATEHFAADSRR